MLERGIGLGFGTDGIRDLWSPFGDGDLLRVALGFARLHGLRTDEELITAVELATIDGAPFVHRRGTIWSPAPAPTSCCSTPRTCRTPWSAHPPGRS